MNTLKKILIISGVFILFLNILILGRTFFFQEKLISNQSHTHRTAPIDFQREAVFFETEDSIKNSLSKKTEFFEREFSGSSFAVVKIPAQNVSSLQSFYKDHNGNFLHTFSQTEKFLGKKFEFITNAGIFSKDYEPLGLYIENKKQIAPLNTSPAGWGNFSLKPNGVFFVKNNYPFIKNTEDFNKQESQNKEKISLTVQSGPLLLDAGKMHHAFQKESKSVYIRNGVGVDSSGNIFFVLSKTPVNFYTFADFFQKKLNCDSALYLDGAISQMEIPPHRIEYFGKFSIMLGVVAE